MTSKHTVPMPDTAAPPLGFRTVGGNEWQLNDANPERFTMIVFYRGLHCPVCRSYLQAFEERLPKLGARGVDVVAVSMDPKERAEEAKDEWGLVSLPVGYGLSETSARAWGLYISEAIHERETKRFSEPGLFLVRPDGQIHYAAIQSMPFGRPDPDALLDAIQFIEDNDYPARGQAA